MGIQDIIALSIAGAAALFAGRIVWRTINKGGCGGSCGCANKSSGRPPGKTPPASPRLVRKPLVTLNEIGTPRGN